jgi:hypothetical protein
VKFSTIRSLAPSWKALIPAAVLVALPTQPASAQESARPSLTGAAAAEMRKTTPEGDYNLKLGPVRVDLTSSLEIEANDNINLSDVDRKGDLILRPSVTAHTVWQVTRVNALHFDLGLGYAEYLNHSQANTSSVLISPDSQLAFDIFVGDFRINIHDRFSILQNPIDEVGLSNVAKFDRLQNSSGISVLWDLNDIKLVLGYDHYIFHSLSSDFDYLNHSEDQFYFSGSASLDSATTVGFDSSFTPVSYEQDYKNGGLTYSAGPFIEKQISHYLKLRLSGGYQGMSFDSGGSNGDLSDTNGFYADLSLAHRLNSHVTESLSVGHEARLGLESNSVEYNYARYVATWQMNQKIGFSLNAFFEDANESDSTISERAKRFGAGLATSYRINRKLTLGLRYGYTKKNSDLALRSYYQNVGAVCLTYDF